MTENYNKKDDETKDYNKDEPYQNRLSYRSYRIMKVGIKRAMEARLRRLKKLHDNGTAGLEKLVDGSKKENCFEINKDDPYCQLAKKKIKINWPK